MSASPDVCVKLDERVRLVAAALAATRYPEEAQAQRPHGTHAHARATRKLLIAHADHDAIFALQDYLDRGVPLEAIFALALRPDAAESAPGWDDQLRDFEASSGLDQWWSDEDAVWQKALGETTRVFARVSLKSFLQPYLGDVGEELVFIPNILYPTDQELGLRVGGDLVCIAPPRLAWGDSPPWPFDEDPAHLYRAALAQYTTILVDAKLRANAELVAEVAQTPLPVNDRFRALYPAWTQQFTQLFVAGLVAVYLEEHLSKAEANAYLLMQRKVRGLDMLPGVISVLRRYLRERDSGRYRTIVELLPNFAKQLRVANRIVSL